MTYDTYWIMEHLGPAATKEDAEIAYQRAEDWYNSTEKAAVLDWYAGYRVSNVHAESIDEDGQLVDNWNVIVIFNRAVSLENLEKV